jgi:IclR family acetate operon transcriptional repressor
VTEGSYVVEDAGSRVQSVDRALRLLVEVADRTGGATVAELAAAADLNRATVWRLLGTLAAHGLVDRDPAANRYRIGYGVLRIAAAADHESLRRRSHPVLEDVSARSGETAALAVIGPKGLTYVDESKPRSVLAVHWLGRDVPLHATSTGKAFLAWLSPPEAAALLEDTLTRYTEHTVTDRGRLIAELAAIHARGWAGCAGELEPTLYGVSAPVLADGHGRPLAIFSIWGTADRVPVSRFPVLGEEAVHAAARISELLTP